MIGVSDMTCYGSIVCIALIGLGMWVLGYTQGVLYGLSKNEERDHLCSSCVKVKNGRHICHACFHRLWKGG